MVTQYQSADKRRVYLAYCTVFAGPNALLRKPKKVREVIEVRQNVFRSLIKDFGLEKIIELHQFFLRMLDVDFVEAERSLHACDASIA
jgi:hypothetical protein